MQAGESTGKEMHVKPWPLAGALWAVADGDGCTVILVEETASLEDQAAAVASATAAILADRRTPGRAVPAPRTCETDRAAGT